MRLPDTDHLTDEDAALVRALYLERWADLSPTEADLVRQAAHLITVVDDDLERLAAARWEADRSEEHAERRAAQHAQHAT